MLVTLAGLVALLLSGCGALVSASSSGFADGLSAAILNEEDPELVRDGLPAYLILLDAMVRADPENSRYLGAAAQLNAAYGIAFTGDDPGRARLLTSRAREYGTAALCMADDNACVLDALDFDGFTAAVDEVGGGDADALYSYCVGSLAYIRSHSDDWVAIASLPRIEYALKHLLTMKNQRNAANVNLYLGILNTLRPEALGGKPGEGRAYFEESIRISDGRDLAAKVEFARSYARLVYDRELHDELLKDVLAASPKQDGLTLFNVLAQSQARELLDSADDYF